jgi:ribonuclease BN (tRNA processing enzyme)
MLRFLGRRSAFHEEQNNAFFIDGDRLVLIDCAMDGFHKIRRAGLQRMAEVYRNETAGETGAGTGEPKETGAGTEGAEASLPTIREIVVLVTHTHGDHIGGIPMLIHYAHYILKVGVTVIVPSEEIRKDMEYVFFRLDGCAPEAYTMLTVEEAKAGEKFPWLTGAILTEHVPELAGRCFGYRLTLGGKNVLYTGDTCTLEPFLPYVTEGTVLYTEVTAFDTPVHLYVGRLLEYVPTLQERHAEVYLMHLDDEEAILEKTRNTGFLPAPLAAIARA